MYCDNNQLKGEQLDISHDMGRVCVINYLGEIRRVMLVGAVHRGMQQYFGRPFACRQK